jgi:hypothetical protein
MGKLTPTPYQDLDLTAAFRTWAKLHGLTPSTIARRTHLSYQYVWSLLNGPERFKYKNIGLFVCCYGIPALEEVLKIAKVKLPIEEWHS